jgi:hypothetical protein
MATDVKTPTTFSDLARMTPPERERVVDFLRAFSIICVVIGHWLIADISQDADKNIVGSNALTELEYGWLLTWFFQVMPIFFFVGGYANFVGVRSFKRRNLGYAAYLTSRVRRMLKPVITLLLVWIPVNFVLDWQNVRSEDFASLLSKLVTQPLWFIGVFIIVTALAWPLYLVHEKWGVKFILVTACIPFLVDWLRFGVDIPAIGYLNIFIWVWIHQLGYAYADGTLLANADSKTQAFSTRTWKKFGGLIMATLGALGLFFCSGIKEINNIEFLNNLAERFHLDDLPYPPSMVGLPGEAISNMNPPTVVIMFLAITQIGLVIVFRDRLQKMLQGERIWTFTVAINSMILTIFCWHQSALCIVTLVRLSLGINEPEVGTATWWYTRPLLLGSYALVLACIVPVFWKYERWRNDDLTGIVSKSAAVSSVIIVIIGLIGLALGGIDDLFGEGSDIMGLFQLNAFLSITLTICGAGVFGVLQNMKKVAQGDLVASQ